ncbi:hypothetical protein PROAA_1270012 [Candidatus Propionivibrio aalborgensis]|uniref:Uncharacterized protein n=1 Tax=Candidatus Propionivibrio aalborgensis TaxID=1860101 RepID=A0A1A8XGT1_9RHOO|nr:hypothetical protein PROAA_1270012 [Candidatus Propionivibrio aalborgensis]
MKPNNCVFCSAKIGGETNASSPNALPANSKRPANTETSSCGLLAAFGGAIERRVHKPVSVNANGVVKAASPVDNTKLLATGPSNTLNCLDMR